MIIRLSWIESINTLYLPDNFEELVKESFRKFTEGTAARSTTDAEKLISTTNRPQKSIPFLQQKHTVLTAKAYCSYSIKFF